MMKTVKSGGQLSFHSNASINYKKVGAENEENDDDVTQASPLCRQILASSGPILVTVASGMTSGYSAILLPQLQQEDSTLKPTLEEESWIASMAPLPMALGCLLGGALMQRYGRRTAHLLICVPYVIGWALCASASHDMSLLMAGRFLTGLCVGLLGPASSVYIAEVSEPAYRGFLLAGIALAIALGLFLAHLLGTFLTWQMTAIICGTFPLAAFALMFVAPESPVWLAGTHPSRRADAQRAFEWCRGGPGRHRRELAALLAASSKDATTNAQQQSSTGFMSSLRDACARCSRPEFYKPLFIVGLFFVTTQCAGNNAVAFYSVTIMADTVAHVDKYVAMLSIDTVRVIMSVVACALLRMCGRRPLALISGLGTAASLLALGTHKLVSNLYTHDPEHILHNGPLAYVPLVALIAFIVFISIGLVPLPWAMTGELFPACSKGIGSGIVASLNFLAFFVVVKTSPDMFAQLGPGGVFLTYGIFALVGSLILCCILPETKDKTLQEIEHQFRNNNSCESAFNGRVLVASVSASKLESSVLAMPAGGRTPIVLNIPADVAEEDAATPLTSGIGGVSKSRARFTINGDDDSSGNVQKYGKEEIVR